MGFIINFLSGKLLDSLFSSKRKWAFIVVIAGALVVSGMVYTGYRHVVNLQAERDQLLADNTMLTANNSQLEQAIKTQQETIDSLRKDFELASQLQQETWEQFQAANRRVTDLEERLSRHDLGFLASRRPGLVENVVNDATEEVLRCIEIATGSPLTAQERDAILPSEINSECPGLANPNFQPGRTE
jgi:hypothetical protein